MRNRFCRTSTCAILLFIYTSIILYNNNLVFIGTISGNTSFCRTEESFFFKIIYYFALTSAAASVFELTVFYFAFFWSSKRFRVHGTISRGLCTSSTVVVYRWPPARVFIFCNREGFPRTRYCKLPCITTAAGWNGRYSEFNNEIKYLIENCILLKSTYLYLYVTTAERQCNSFQNRWNQEFTDNDNRPNLTGI